MVGRKKQPKEEAHAQRQRLAFLLSYVRSRLESQKPQALVTHLNRNLPKGKRFSTETVNRWERGEQGISPSNLSKVGKELQITSVQLKEYLAGTLPFDSLKRAIDGVEIPADESEISTEIIRLMRKLSTGLLLEVMNRAWEILQERLGGLISIVDRERSPNSTIAELVLAHQVDCTEMFDEIIPNHEERIQAILQGQRPTDEELELIGQVSATDIEEMIRRRKEEFGNGNGTNHQEWG